MPPSGFRIIGVEDMVDQKTRTKIRIDESDREFLERVANHTGHSKEDMLKYSVRLLEVIMEWRLNSPSPDDLDMESIVEDYLIDALLLAQEIERLGGANRIIMEGADRDRWDITPDRSSKILRRKRWRRR